MRSLGKGRVSNTDKHWKAGTEGLKPHNRPDPFDWRPPPGRERAAEGWDDGEGRRRGTRQRGMGEGCLTPAAGVYQNTGRGISIPRVGRAQRRPARGVWSQMLRNDTLIPTPTVFGATKTLAGRHSYFLWSVGSALRHDGVTVLKYHQNRFGFPNKKKWTLKYCGTVHIRTVVIRSSVACRVRRGRPLEWEGGALSTKGPG